MENKKREGGKRIKKKFVIKRKQLKQRNKKKNKEYNEYKNLRRSNRKKTTKRITGRKGEEKKVAR